MCSFCCTENVSSIISFSPRVLQHVFSYCSKSVCYSCLQICNIWSWCRKQLVLTYPNKKKSRGVPSGDRGGQGVGPSLPIHLFGNVASKNRRTSEPQCGGAPLVGKLSTAETLLTEVFVCIPRSFLVINVCNRERLYAHPVIL